MKGVGTFFNGMIKIRKKKKTFINKTDKISVVPSISYTTKVTGKAIFQCRNQEEATWYALLLNNFFKKINAFPIDRNIYELKPDNKIGLFSSIKIYGIYTTVSEKTNRITIYANGYPVESKNGYFMFFPLYFLSKQAKSLYCNFVLEGTISSDLHFFKKSNKNNEIVYKRYIDTYFKLNTHKKFSIFDITKNYISFFEPISSTIKCLPKGYKFNDKINVIGDDFEKAYKINHIFKKIFSLLFERKDVLEIFDNINNQLFKYSYTKWKMEIDKIEVKQNDIKKFLKKKNSLNCFDKNSNEDLLKLQAIFVRLFDALYNSDVLRNKKILFKINPKDNFLYKKDYHHELILIIKQNYMYFGYICGKKIFENTLDEHFNFEIKPTNELDIINFFSSFLPSKEDISPLSLFNLSKFEGDFYEYCKKLPKVYLNRKFNIPLESNFVSLFFNELQAKKIMKEEDDIYHLIEKNNKNHNLYPSLCETCIHKIRKQTIGCSDCFDFKFLK